MFLNVMLQFPGGRYNFFRVRKRTMETGRICCVQLSQSDGWTPLIPPSHNVKAGVYWKDAGGNNEKSLVTLRSEYREGVGGGVAVGHKASRRDAKQLRK